MYTYFKHLWYTIHNVKKNFLGLTTGGSGDGKSWGSIIHAYFLDPRFDIDKIVYTDTQFYNALDRIKYVGEFIIWDEAGIGIPAKEWYKISNKAIGKVLSKLDILKKHCEEVKKKIGEYLTDSGKFDVDLIRVKRDVSRNDAVAIKKLLEKEFSV